MSASEQTVSRKKEVLAIGVPAIIESLFTTFSSMIDTRMISRMGTTAISAISVTNQPRLFVLCIFFAINTTVSATVAHSVGQKDRRRANELFITAWIIAAVASIVLGVLCVIFAGPIMEICSGQRDTMELSTLYFRIIMGSMVFTTSFSLVNSALRGCGNTRVTMQTNIASTLIHIGLNYLLIEGHCGFPAMGVMGAAWATVIGTIVALLISVARAMDDKLFVSLRYAARERIVFSMQAVRDMFTMWKNICLENLLMRLGFLLGSMMTARTGSFDSSVYHVALHLMNVNFSIGDGLQAASVALIGRSVGDKNIEEIRGFTRTIFRAGIGCSIVLAAAYVFGGNWFYSMFSDDVEFIRRGFIACALVAAMTPFQIPQVIFNGILKAMNCSRETLWIAIFSVTFLNTLLDYILCFTMGLGLWGILGAAVVTQVVRALMLEVVYKKKIPKLEAELAAA